MEAKEVVAVGRHEELRFYLLRLEPRAELCSWHHAGSHVLSLGQIAESHGEEVLVLRVASHVERHLIVTALVELERGQDEPVVCLHRSVARIFCGLRVLVVAPCLAVVVGIEHGEVVECFLLFEVLAVRRSLARTHDYLVRSECLARLAVG